MHYEILHPAIDSDIIWHVILKITLSVRGGRVTF